MNNLTEVESDILDRVKAILAPIADDAREILRYMEAIEAGVVDCDLENVDILRLEVRCEHVEVDLNDVLTYVACEIIGYEGL